MPWPDPAAALRRLLPAGQCEVCRQWCRGSALCGACSARFAAPQPRCGRCGLRLGQPAAACGRCLAEPPPFARTVCAADYAFPWDRLIAAFKFHNRCELAPALAGVMADAVRAAAGARPSLLLPVPLSAARLAERGYNQAWQLTRALRRQFGCAADARLLQRPVDTAPQAGSSRAARQRNLQAAFMADPARRDALSGRHVALVDDVMTTGATARAAAAVLLRAGALTVDVWVLARTPAPG